MSKNLETLIALLSEAQQLVFFTGAGLSTESGIPDFRSPGTGLWNKIKPIDFSDFVNSEDARAESWRRKFTGDRAMTTAEPNSGHLAIAELIGMNRCNGVITQNVDNRIQSGVDETHIVELHGNATYAACLSCGQRYELAELESQYQQNQYIDPCPLCSGLIKTATISFGQAMPEDAMQRAAELTSQCDLMIVLGSSLTVYPAAACPEHVVQRGDKLVIINQQPTGLDSVADLVINESIGSILPSAVAALATN